MFVYFSSSWPPALAPLSLHDALPISFGEMGLSRDHTRAFYGLLAPAGTPRPNVQRLRADRPRRAGGREQSIERARVITDRKSRRLNSTHVKTSYAVFCSQKKTLQLST